MQLFGTIILSLWVTCSLALTNEGRQFYVGFGYQLAGGANGRNELIITGPQDTEVNILCNSPAVNISTTISDDGMIREVLPSTVRITGQGSSNKGVKITADNDITVHGSNALPYSADGYLAMPVDESFTFFYLVAYPPRPGLRRSQFYVVGTEDDTTVTVYRTIGNGEHALFSTFDLDEMEVYTYLSTADDYTGWFVNSTRPISVFSGHECTEVPQGLGNCDHLVVQLPPLSEFVEQYIAPPIGGRSTDAGYRVRVVSAYPDTGVEFINEDYQEEFTLQPGQFAESDVPNTASSLTIRCNQSCIAAQYNKGGQNEGFSTDPFMMLLTSPWDFSRRVTFGTMQTAEEGNFDNYISIVTYNSHIPRLRLNNASLESEDWTPVNGSTDRSTMHMNIADGSYVLESSSDEEVLFAAYVYGHGVTVGESYGYRAGFGDSSIVTTTPGPTPSGSPPPSAGGMSQEIIMNGTFTTDGTTLTSQCISAYSNQFQSKGYLMLLYLRSRIGDDICDTFPHANVEEGDTTFVSMGTGGFVAMGYIIPNAEDVFISAMLNCSLSVIDFVRDFDNWGRPILDQVDGCPPLTFEPDQFDVFYWEWLCSPVDDDNLIQ